MRESTHKVRPAAVASMFYPGDVLTLRSEVEKYLSEARELSTAPPKAMIVPHAGYVYSGPVAATAYKTLQPVRQTIKRVILLGPVHRVSVNGLAAPGVEFFETPLGTIPLDTAALEELTQRFAYVNYSDEAHRMEHSLEVHLPFLQVVLEEFKLVPLAVGEAPPHRVAEVLQHLWGGQDTLIVISSDLSHFLNYESAQTLDLQTAAAIERFDGQALHYDSACGRNPVKGLLELGKQGRLQVTRADLRNSGDTAGPKNRVVGYGSWLFHEVTTH